MDLKTYFGFQFVKIGIARLSEVSTDIRYCGQMVRNWDVVLEFLYPGCENTSQSTYLVFANDELKYAGIYSGVLHERWLLARNGLWYIWHSENDFRIQALLKSDHPPEVSLWLCLHPYLTASDGEVWNINMELERKLIVNHQPDWNIRGKMTPTTGVPLFDILGRPSENRSPSE
ncbi:MAG: hypothetical protein ACO1RT_04740 [Planctomycetaceae bacterium]